MVFGQVAQRERERDGGKEKGRRRGIAAGERAAASGRKKKKIKKVIIWPHDQNRRPVLNCEEIR